jgi:hypothetical protein
MMVAEIVIALANGCWVCGLFITITLLSIFLAVVGVPIVAVVWLVRRVRRPPPPDGLDELRAWEARDRDDDAE